MVSGSKSGLNTDPIRKTNMGDSSRFRLMADLIASRIPTSARIADVAGGKGHLQSEMFLRGYRNIVSWDTRLKYAGPRRSYRYGLFDFRSAPRDYDAVVGMHPDGGTDHIVAYAIKHKKPFVVCPCCVLPSASKLEDVGYDGWIRHLTKMACDAGFGVETISLPMAGRKLVLAGTPPAAHQPHPAPGGTFWDEFQAL